MLLTLRLLLFQSNNTQLEINCKTLDPIQFIYKNVWLKFNSFHSCLNLTSYKSDARGTSGIELLDKLFLLEKENRNHRHTGGATC